MLTVKQHPDYQEWVTSSLASLRTAWNIWRTDGWIIFGYIDYSQRVIWLPWLPFAFLRRLRDNHERAHAWGLRRCIGGLCYAHGKPCHDVLCCTYKQGLCQTPPQSLSCAMYEGGDNLREKITSWPRAVWRRLTTGEWFCNSCKSYLVTAGAIDPE